MGLFKGNKNKNKGDGDEAAKPSTQRKSRRVVIPGQKGTSPAPAGSGSSRVQNKTSPAAPAANPGVTSTGRVRRPTPDGVQKPSHSDSGRVKPPADDGLMLGAPSLDLSSDAPSSAPTPARPKSREPIRDSQPLDFAGDLSLASEGPSGPARTGDKALLEFLVSKANLISEEQAQLASQRADRDGTAIDVALVAMEAVSEDQLVSALTQECWVPHLRVDKYEIRKKALDTIGREDSLRYSVFPVDKLGSLLTLAMVNPLDNETIRVLEGKTGLDIKKVVATRSEISQGIEKYYSGQVEAKDTSISFTQDVEPKSVTQMLTNVKVKDEQIAALGLEPSLDMDEPAIVPARHTQSISKSASDSDIIPEIQDIDDLLSSDEVIAPAIIEPIGIEPIDDEDEFEPAAIPDAEIEPMGINPGEIEVSSDEFDEIAISTPDAEPAIASARSDDSGGIDVGDFDLSLDDTAHIAPVAKVSESVGLPPAPEFLDEPAIAAPAAKESDKFDLDDLGLDPVEEVAAPEISLPPVAAVKPAAPAPAPVAKSAAPVPAKPSAPAPVAKPAAPAPIAKPAAPVARPAPAKTAARAPQIINLVPVMEEEFQHAITHGKAHLFERWVGLQTRNRIINGIAVEAELDDLLEGLYAAPRRVG